MVGFLWSAPKGGFGGKINIGKLDDILAGIQLGDGFYYVPEARAWVTQYPAESLPKAEKVYAAPVFAGQVIGINTLYQKCPHLGCRVPQCLSSQWFECPCHGSQYNRVGEKQRRAGAAGHGPLRVHGQRRRGHRRHRHDLPRSADRHQHHRPGAAGPPLHHGWGVT